MQAVVEMAMAKAIGMGIFYTLTPEAAEHQARMERVTGWAIKRYGAEWALPRYYALGQLSIESALKTREQILAA